MHFVCATISLILFFNFLFFFYSFFSGNSLKGQRSFLAIIQAIGQSMLLLTTLLYTKGWLHGREKISARGRTLIAIMTTTYATFTVVLLVSSNGALVVVPDSFDLPMRTAPYTGRTGTALVLIRWLVAAWIAYVVVTTLRRDTDSVVGRVGLIGIAWLIVPCLVNGAVSQEAQCGDRPIVVASEVVCTLVLVLSLVVALWPFQASIQVLRTRSSVKKANLILSRCIRTCGCSCVHACCCPGKFVWVVGLKPIDVQSQELHREVTSMYKSVMSLTSLLKDMQSQTAAARRSGIGTPGARSMLPSLSGVEERRSFGGGWGTMEEVRSSSAGGGGGGGGGDNVWESNGKQPDSSAGDDVWENIDASRSVRRTDYKPNDRKFVLPAVSSNLKPSRGRVPGPGR